MPQPKPQKIRAVPGGHEVRLRYGKGMRGRFVITGARDEADARDRAAKLADGSAELAASGHSEHARDLLEKVCAAGDARTFAARLKVLHEVASGRKTVAATAPKGSGLTFQQLGERWTNGELARDYPDHVKVKRSVEDDVYRLERLYSEIGPVPLAAFKLEDAERAMRKLSADLSVASRRHYAQLISRVLQLAVYPARVIASSPVPRGWLPKLGPRKARAYLYPTEDAKLMACVGAAEQEGVPLVYRLLYGFLAREGLRAGEAFGLTFADFDLDLGTVNLDENKTDDPRTWALDPGVARALKAWKEKFRKGCKATDLVFRDPAVELDQDKLADRLREHLALAKVTRQELFKSTTARKRLTAHDLRGTFVTLALASGKTETWVMDRTGHTTSAMLNRYRRAARSAAELGLGTLLALDEAIPELKVGQKVGQSGSSPARGRQPAQRKVAVKTAGCTRRDLNSHALRRRNLNPVRLPFRHSCW